MSPNTHTLHLFFEDRLRLRLAQLVFRYIAKGNEVEARRWAAQWSSADAGGLWNSDWFNLEVHATATHLVVRLDTGPHEPPPLMPLEHMFGRGLQAAVLETFHSQVREPQRMYFLAGQWVLRAMWLEANPAWAAWTERGGDPAEPAGEQASGDYQVRDPRQPQAIAALREREEAQQRKAQQAAQDLADAIRDLGQSGGPQAVASGFIGIVVLRAACCVRGSRD